MTEKNGVATEVLGQSAFTSSRTPSRSATDCAMCAQQQAIERQYRRKSF